MPRIHRDIRHVSCPIQHGIVEHVGQTGRDQRDQSDERQITQQVADETSEGQRFTLQVEFRPTGRRSR